MDAIRIKKSSLSGEITIPPSKSHTLRAILFGSLAKGKSRIDDYLASPDTTVMIESCRLFGAKIDIHPTHLDIEGTSGIIDTPSTTLYTGNSGITLRFCTALAALNSKPILIKNDGSLRPMGPLVNALSQLGVKTQFLQKEGFAPLIVQGPINPGQTHLRGEDSQHVSSLLIAGAFAQGPLEIDVQNPGEKPWILLTLDWLKKMGLSYQNHQFERYTLQGKGTYSGFHYTVPGDFSTAAFPLIAALITHSEITLHNLEMEDVQGDKAIIPLLQQLGAHLEIDAKKKQLHVKQGGVVKGREIDINNFIDALPILTVLGCFAEGKTRLYNAAIAKTKESDRIFCMAQELAKMGGKITVEDDGLTVEKSALKAACLNSHQDHRIAMALSVAALQAEGESILSSTSCIAKTYPTFLDDFKALNGNIHSHGQ